jgi:peptide chain release factor 1
MNLNWQSLQNRFQELETKILSSALDQFERQKLQKEYAYLRNLLNFHAEMEQLEKELAQAKEQATQESDPELRELFTQEIQTVSNTIEQRSKELDAILYPPDPMDDRSSFIEMRAGAGGQEAALFVGDLARMYTNYAAQKNWKVSVASVSQTELGGFREMILHIEGKGVYGHLKFESGVHRVQRVPKTETAGRVHTSTATVAVLPEVEEVEVTINPSDLRIDTFRAGGAGGQHVNKTDSAVRITHLPTGLAVACQDERSQHKNKDKAMKMLQSRLYALEAEKQRKEISQTRKEMVGTGERAEKIRTYNFPQNRVTDHQVDITLKSLDLFVEGEIDEVIQALRQKEWQDRKKHPVLSLNLN